MNLTHPTLKLVLVFSVAFASLSVAAQTINVSLSGAQEVPAVSTTASGSGTITIGADQSVSGSVMTTGVEGTMAHIHLAAAGQNGPVIVPMTRLQITSGQSLLARNSPTLSIRALKMAICTSTCTVQPIRVVKLEANSNLDGIHHE